MKPSNVDLRKVEGRYIMGVRDGEDPDSEPDFIAAEGVFEFLASVPYLPDPTADPAPVVIFPPFVKGVLDDEGYLCTARVDGTPGERGVWLIVTDDPDLPVTDWTWNVVYEFTMVDGVLPKIDPHSFAVPSGPEPINLVTVVKTPASPGYGMPQAEAAVLRAEGAAASSAEDAALAVAAADRAEVVAGATDAGVAILLNDPQTVTGGLMEEKMELKADTGTVSEALALKAEKTSVALKEDRLVGDPMDPGFYPIQESLEHDVRLVSVNENYVFPPPLEERLDNRFIGRGELVINAKDYGAKADGTDATVALNAAANTAAAFGAYLFVPPGIYETTSAVYIKCNIYAYAAQINYSGAGTAIAIGSSGDLLMGGEYHLPFVNHSSGGWEGTSVGIDLINLYSAQVSFRRIKGFETGLSCRGALGRGMVYNTLTVGYLDNNRVNLLLTHDETGWINENTYIGGRYAHIESGSFGTVGDLNTHHIMLKRGSTTIGGPNNNVFLKPSLEGNPVDQYRVVFDGARYNAIINARWETAGAYPAKVKYLSGSDFNRLTGGYDLWKVVEEFATGTTGGTINDGAGALVLIRSATTQTLASGATAVFAGWNPGSSALRRCTYEAGTFTPRPGDWNVSVQIAIDSNATGIRRAWLKTTDGATLAISECGPTGSARAVLKLEGRASFTGANGFYVEVYQNSGVDLATASTTGYCTVNAQLAPV